MPAKDAYHDAVRNALVKDGWTITHDPYTLTFGGRDVFVDIGAEKPIAAEREGRRIAVEIKSFLGPSEVHDLQVAVGQYVFYRSLIETADPGRELFLAVTDLAYEGIWGEEIAQPIRRKEHIAFVVFDAAREGIVRWIP